jgi:protein-tyrosine phosphatase
VPSHWRLVLRGWPGLNTHLLVNLVNRVLNDGEPERFDHTYHAYASGRKNRRPQRHPHDDGVLIGAAESLLKLPAGVDAVVSLCRVADGHIPAAARHLDVRLIDQSDANANLDFVLLDTVRAIEQLRAEGATVFLHGLCGHSRTPAVAALYGARRAGIEVDRALADVCAVLHGADPNPEFRAALHRLHPQTERAHR